MMMKPHALEPPLILKSQSAAAAPAAPAAVEVVARQKEYAVRLNLEEEVLLRIGPDQHPQHPPCLIALVMIQVPPAPLQVHPLNLLPLAAHPLTPHQVYLKTVQVSIQAVCSGLHVSHCTTSKKYE